MHCRPQIATLTTFKAPILEISHFDLFGLRPKLFEKLPKNFQMSIADVCFLTTKVMSLGYALYKKSCSDIQMSKCLFFITKFIVALRYFQRLCCCFPWRKLFTRSTYFGSQLQEFLKLTKVGQQSFCILYFVHLRNQFYFVTVPQFFINESLLVNKTWNETILKTQNLFKSMILQLGNQEFLRKIENS